MASTNTQTAPRWTVTSVSLPTTIGTFASGTVNLTISNVVNGTYSGHDLSAKNFKIGGASGPVNVGSGFKWTGGNVDSEVNYVIFTDNGTAGDPTNTINAAVTLNSTSITSGNANQNIYVDIDEMVSDTPPAATRRCCLKTVYPNPYGSDHTISITDITSPNITESSLGNSSATPGGVGWSNLNVTQHTGVVSEGVANKIAELTFTASSGHYYSAGSPFAGFQNLLQSQNGYHDYTNNYSFNVFNKIFDGLGRMTSFKIEAFYTPPTIGSGAVDPGEGMCPLDHKLFIEYMLNGIPSDAGNMLPVSSGGNIYNVVFPSDIKTTGGSKRVCVKGTPGASYTMKVTKTAGHDSSTAAASGAYYNFTTDEFQDLNSLSMPVVLTSTIDAKGQDVQDISIPSSSSNARYDIVVGSANGSTLASAVPNAAGEAKMLQYGNATFTLQVSTSTASNFGTLPAAVTVTKQSSNFPNLEQNYSTWNKIYSKGSTQVRGQSRGASTDRLIINDKKVIDRIKPGMKITSSTGSVADGTTVLSVDRRSNKVVLSSAQAISDVDLQFEPIYGEKSFSFTITPGTEGEGSTATLNVNTSNTIQNSTDKIFGAPQSITKTVDGAVSESATVQLDEYEGLVAGMSVFGSGVGDGVTLNELVNPRSITLSEASTSIADNTVLTFTGGVGNIYLTRQSVVKVGANIIISGAFRCDSIPADVTCNINIDNLINVS
tara:strand:- start:3343 stop:5490 length:2148 start_codon:yes stop_codon:yes gene_type:complete